MKILYEDDELIIVYKPSGIAVQTSRISEKDLYTMLRSYLFSRDNIDNNLWIINRLDQPVKGLVVFAKTEVMASKMSKLIQTKEIKKSYYSVVQGCITNNIDNVLISYIEKDKKNNKAIIHSKNDKNNKNIKRAELQYKVIESNEEKNFSVLEIELITGRFHQIRAQLASIGLPILYDEKYGYEAKKDPNYDEINDKGQIALCAYKIEFIHPHTRINISISLLEKGTPIVDFLCKYE